MNLNTRLGSFCLACCAWTASTLYVAAAPTDVAPLIDATTNAVVVLDLTKIDLAKDMSGLTKTLVDLFKKTSLPPIAIAQIEPMLKTMTLPVVTRFNPSLQKMKTAGKAMELFILMTPSDADIPGFIAVAAPDDKPKEEVTAIREAFHTLGCSVNFVRHGFVFGIAPPSQLFGPGGTQEEADEEGKEIKAKTMARAKERFGEIKSVEAPKLEAAMEAFAEYPIRGIALQPQDSEETADDEQSLPSIPGLPFSLDQMKEMQTLMKDGVEWIGFGVDIRGMKLLGEMLCKDADTANQIGAALDAQRSALTSAAPGEGGPAALEQQLINLMSPKVVGDKLVVKIDPATLGANPQVLEAMVMGLVGAMGGGGGLPPGVKLPPGTKLPPGVQIPPQQRK